MSRPHLDWTDPEAVAKWLVNLRVTIDDADSVTVDMLRPYRRRELGPALARQQHDEARKGIARLLDYATAAPDEGEPGDPAGNGGAGPTH